MNAKLSRPDPGQRIEALLNRGMADEWYPGTVRDDGSVELDYEPPGMSTSVTMDDIADWRPAEPK